MSEFIPLSVPCLRGNELDYVNQTIRTEWVSSAGQFTDRFEKELACYVATNGAVACQNGTAGLHLALIAMGIQPGDGVIVPALTFVAAVNPVTYLGAEPIFMDCDDSLCMDPAKLREWLQTECLSQGGATYTKTGLRVRAIIVVHVFGNLADMETLLSLCAEHNLLVLEDATEALGTRYTHGKYEGCYAGTLADIGVYSFNGNKIITTGGGGMVVSKDIKLLDRVRHLSTQAKTNDVYFQHDEVGYNYRMTNVQAAIGVAQLEQLEGFIMTKTRNYQRYLNGLNPSWNLSMLPFREGIRANHWFYCLYLRNGNSKIRDQLISHFQLDHIQTRPIWWPIHHLPFYKNKTAWRIEKTVHYWERVVNLPCSSTLRAEDVDRVLNSLETFMCMEAAHAR